MAFGSLSNQSYNDMLGLRPVMQTNALISQASYYLPTLPMRRTYKDPLAEALQRSDRKGLGAQAADLGEQLKHQKPDATATRVGNSAEPSKSVSNMAGTTRKYNFVCGLLFGLANTHHAVQFGGMARPKLKKLLDALAKAGLYPDDETLEKHLRHGSDQAARMAKSQN